MPSSAKLFTSLASLTHSEHGEQLNNVLRWCYCASLVIWPIVAVIYLAYHSASLGITDQEIDFLQRSYFLVVLFGLFFMILYSMYLPTTLRDTASLLLAPLIGGLLQLVLAGDKAMLYIAEIAMIYTMEIATAFLLLWLFIVGLSIANMVTERTLSSVVSGLGFVGIQLLYVIPCAGAVYLFGRIIFTVILPNTYSGHSALSVMAIITYGLFAIPFGQNMYVYLKCLYQESILA